MKKSFRETKFGSVLIGIVSLLYAGLLCLVCSVPVITAGPCFTALYYTVAKSVRHKRGNVTANFSYALRVNFRPALKAWLPVLLYLLLGAAGVYGINALGDRAGSFLSVLSKLFFVPAAILIVWLFPYISRFDNPLGHSIKLCFLLGLKNFGNTILMLIYAVVFGVIGWYFPFLIPLFPGFVCYFMSFQLEPIFKPITLAMEDENPDQWYNE